MSETKDYWEYEDYNLAGCLHYNPQDLLGMEDITEVLAVWEGENDGDDWRWVVALKGNLFAFIQGGCDYTGWDCQSWAYSSVHATPEYAVDEALAGHGWRDNNEEVWESLRSQINYSKNETWRERKDKELGVVSKFAGPSYD